MGTRGLKIILFRGRYFIYYNNYDSYPQGLGKEFVCSIPTGADQYKEWLENERASYAKLTAELESKVLTISQDKINDLVNTETTHGAHDENQSCLPWEEIDGELYRFPSALCDVGNDLWIEWVYVIDLDNELFSVDNWIFFDLWDIPQDRWIQAFGWEDDIGQKVFSFEVCPEGSAGFAPAGYFDDEIDGERDKFHALCQQYGHSTIKGTCDINVSCQAALQQVISIMVFEEFTSPSASHLWEYVPGWGHKTFAFREVAFAVLSLAAGQYYLEDPSRFIGYHARENASCYLIDRSKSGEAKLMPVFGSGCHSSDQQPGSAPINSIYWFESVLISLVPDTVFEKDTDAAIAKAVEHGVKEGKVKFQIVLFSILNAILLEVCVEDGRKVVKRTGMISIYNSRSFDHVDDNGVDVNSEGGVLSPIEQICQKNSGFLSLQNFFNVAATSKLSVFGKGCFPTEIYARIISSADCLTRKACAEVSVVFRQLCQEYYSLGSNFKIVKFEPSSYPPGSQNQMRRRPWVRLNELGTFVFQDHNTGQITRSGFQVEHQILIADERKVIAWCPVVGTAARPSMITSLSLRVLPK